MKNKKLIIPLIVFATIAYLGADLTVKPRRTSSSVQTEMRKVEAVIPSETPKKMTINAPTAPIPEVFPSPQDNTPLRKKKFHRSIEGKPHAALPPGFVIAENIFSVRKEDFTSFLGDLIEERNGNVFFRAPEKPVNTQLAISDASGKLYNVSSVIKVNKVDEKLRETLTGMGFQEYYYQEDLKTLYMEASGDDVFKTYEELASLHIKPDIELIRSYHKPK